jgi:hypothetical protein
MMNRAIFTAALAGALLMPGIAAAQSGQPWLEDRRVGEGVGIRTGDLEWHPGVAGQLGYDTNYFQGSGEAAEPEIDVLRFRVTPSLTLKTLGSQRNPGGGQAAPPVLNFAADASLSYDKLIALGSGENELEGTDSFLSGGLGFALDILPERPWGADLNGNVTRLVQPSNDPTIPPAFNRDILRGGAGIKWRPGGGVFSWRLGFQTTYTLFEDSDYSDLNNFNHAILASGRWKFLPRTAFLYEGQVSFIDYGDANSGQVQATPISSKIGLAGLVTNHFALLGMVGWLATFYDVNGGQVNDYDGPIGQAQVTWYPVPDPKLEPGSAVVGLSSIALGYVRSAENSYLGNYVQTDRVYADLDYFIAGRVVLSLQGGFSHLTRPQSFFPNSTTERNPAFGENRADATAFTEYRVSDSVGINLTLIYSGAFDNRRVLLTEDGAQSDNMRFDRYEAWLGARWFL